MSRPGPERQGEALPQVPSEYTIKKGDALLRIVGKFFPQFNENQRIYACFVLKTENNVPNINSMHAGFKLKIPQNLEQRCKDPNIDWRKVRGEFMAEWNRAQKKVRRKTQLDLTSLQKEAKKQAALPAARVEATAPIVQNREPAEQRPRPAAVPRPAEAVREARVDQVPWNRGIVPTWDDGPDRAPTGQLQDGTPEIIQKLREHGVTDFRFFWTGANLLTKDAQTKMGISYNKEAPVSSQVGAGRWEEWIAANKPQNMSREDFIRSLIDPAIIQKCAQIKATLPANVNISDVFGYHGMLHPLSKSGEHIQNRPPEEIAEDIGFFQELMRVAFNDPSYQVRHGRPPYGAGFAVPGTKQTGEHTPQMMQAAQMFGQQNKCPFTWELWRTESEDWNSKKPWNPDRVAAGAVRGKTPGTQYEWDKGPGSLLMHSRYYRGQDSRKLDDLFRGIEVADSGVKLELGKWTVEKLNSLLAQAQQITDLNQRMDFLSKQFLTNNTKIGATAKYEYKLPKLPDGMIRIRLETFDCITFVQYMMAMCHSRNISELAENLKRGRYENPDRPTEATKLDYTYNVMQRALQSGNFEDVTSSLGASLTTTTRTLNRRKRKGMPVTDAMANPAVNVNYIASKDVRKVMPRLKAGDIVLWVANPDRRVGGVASGALQHLELIAFGHGTLMTQKPGRPNEAFVRQARVSHEVIEDSKGTVADYAEANGGPYGMYSGIVVLRPKQPAQQ